MSQRICLSFVVELYCFFFSPPLIITTPQIYLDTHGKGQTPRLETTGLNKLTISDKVKTSSTSSSYHSKMFGKGSLVYSQTCNLSNEHFKYSHINCIAYSTSPKEEAM